MDSRLLVVEDNLDLLDLSMMMLELLGYNPIGVATAEEALSLLEIEKYGLLLTDLTLPKMSGGDLIKIVRKKYPDLPIVVVSGYDRPRCLAEDIGFLTKPYLITDLKAKLEQTLVVAS